MGLNIERVVPDYSDLPETDTRTYPTHGKALFKRIKGTDIYVCPYSPEEHGTSDHLVDSYPGGSALREGHG